MGLDRYVPGKYPRQLDKIWLDESDGLNHRLFGLRTTWHGALLDYLLSATATNVVIPVGARMIVDPKIPHLTRMAHLDNKEIDQMLMYEWLNEGLRL